MNGYLFEKKTPINANPFLQQLVGGWCSSSFCSHPPCPKPLDWLDVQSNLFSLTFSKSTFQTIPVVEYPPSSTSMFLQHTIPYSKLIWSTVLYAITILFFNSNFIFPLSNSPRLLNAFSQLLFDVSLLHDIYRDMTLMTISIGD